MAQAEDGAVGGDGHGDDDGVDIHHELGEAEGTTEIIDGYREDGQTEKGGGIDGAVAKHGAGGEV